MIARKAWLLAGLLFGVLALSACGGGSSGGSEPPPIDPNPVAPLAFSSMIPAQGATDVPLDQIITMTFNKTLNCSTVNSSTVTLSAQGTAVAGAVSCNGSSITFTPAGPMSPLTQHILSVTGIADSAGKTLSAPESRSFTTGIDVDHNMPGLTASPVFSKSIVNRGESLSLTLPVTSSSRTVTVCIEPILAQSAQISKAAVDAGDCEVIDNAAGANTIPVTVNIPATAIEADYYPRLLLSDGTNYRYERADHLSTTHYAYAVGSTGWTVSQIPIPILIVGPASDLQMSITGVSMNGNNVIVNYRVRNIGVKAAGSFSIDFYVDPAKAPAVGQSGDFSTTIASLAVDATHTGSVTIPGFSAIPKVVMALADSAGVVAESDEKNNLATWVTLSAPVATSTSTDVPKAIPSASSVTSTLAVSGAPNPLRYLAVDLGITHPFAADLVITLISPAGTEVVLSNRRGGTGANFTGTVFHDNAATAISAGSAPFTGQFRPESPLAAFTGENSNGTWRLKVQDIDPLDDGTLNGWGLRLW